MNIFLINTESGVNQPPISVGGFVDVPSPGEIIVGTTEVDFDYFLGYTVTDSKYRIETVSKYSLIQSEQLNSKPILRPWYEGTLGDGKYCLVNQEPNSVPHYDVPFLAFRQEIRDSYAGIVLRSIDNLDQLAYYSNYSYDQNTLGSTCSFRFIKRINLPAGSYVFAHAYNEIMRPSTTLKNFIILYLMLGTLKPRALFNETNVSCKVTSEGYIQVDIPENVEGDSLTLKLEF